MSHIDLEMGWRSQERRREQESRDCLAMDLELLLEHGPHTPSPEAVTGHVRATMQNPLDEIAHLFKKPNDHEPTPPPDDQDFDSAA